MLSETYSDVIGRECMGISICKEKHVDQNIMPRGHQSLSFSVFPAVINCYPNFKELKTIIDVSDIRLVLCTGIHLQLYNYSLWWL